MKSKFTLNYTYDGSDEFAPVDVKFEMPGDITIGQFLHNAECFLKACGFHFDGNIDIVQEENDIYLDKDYDNNLNDIVAFDPKEELIPNKENNNDVCYFSLDKISNDEK